MNFLKKLAILTLTMIVFTSTVQCAYCKTVKKEIEVTTKDSYILKATLTYMKIDGVQKYPTVLLLHSLGYSSENWGNLIANLNSAGFAVIAMDLRGHGKSVYNSNLQRKTWVYFKPKAYLKYPSDVVAVLNQAQKQSKKVSLNNLAIVGADIGANTAVLAAKSLPKKPKALVLISPSLTFKGLYLPVAMTEIGTVPVLTMASQQDGYSLDQEKKLSKFAQGSYFVKNYPKGGMGMMMLQSNPIMSIEITKWLMRYL